MLLMDHTEHRSGPVGGRGGETPISFALFALSHAGCGDWLSEARLDENTVAYWCSRCDDARTFGPTEGSSPTKPITRRRLGKEYRHRRRG